VTPQLAAEVAEALSLGAPVVALETTLVSHGFSAGRGLAAALESERRVRAAGAIPATIGVVDGVIRVGLNTAELERFAEAGPAARKVGARDLAACVVQRALGSTTVGGTLAVCALTGIHFVGTGGIGGVHRGFARTPDISADLPQLARTPAMVVCSGAKSILDVPATCELLETLGVPVLGWQTATLPLFYSAEGGPPVSAEVRTAAEAAAVAAVHWQLNHGSGLILARPPQDGLDLSDVVDRAVAQVAGQGITGQAVTPAILTAVEDLSGGRSVEVNRRLIADNAALAAQVAVAYVAARQEGQAFGLGAECDADEGPD
jgi:pseudouridine-5'-phosphate glycosidase